MLALGFGCRLHHLGIEIIRLSLRSLGRMQLLLALGVLLLQLLERSLRMGELSLAHVLDDCQPAVIHDEPGENRPNQADSPGSEGEGAASCHVTAPFCSDAMLSSSNMDGKGTLET
ncbi:hypothetical protein D9M68_490790 [compost metagenome]